VGPIVWKVDKELDNIIINLSQWRLSGKYAVNRRRPPGKLLDKEEKESRNSRIVSEMLISPTVTALNEQANFSDSRLISCSEVI